MASPDPTVAAALARLYDLDVAPDAGDLDLYLALFRRVGGPVVELCAGTGRIAIPLATAGADVTLVDLDEAMLDRARARVASVGPDAASRLRFVHGDLHDVSIPDRGHFRLGLIGLNSILLLGGPREQRHAINVLASLLEPGGIAVVDAWLPLPEDLIRFDGRLGLEWIRRDPDSGLDVMKTSAAWYDSATRAVTLTTVFEESRPGGPAARWIREDELHLVSASDLRMYAEDAGLEVDVMAGGYDLDPIALGAERAVLVARRPGAGPPAHRRPGPPSAG